LESNLDKNIKVSICCLTYNHSNYIRDCLNGFINQKTDFNFEILIHDDASLDNTPQIIREYEKRYPEIIKPIYQNENKFSKEGGGMNIRYNFPRIQGKYIALCEGDDYWTDPLKLQKQVDILENNQDYILCFHDVIIQYTRKNSYKTYRMIGSLEKDILETEDLIRPWFIPTCSILYRKVLIDTYPKWISITDSGDIALILFLSTLGKFYYFNEVMGIYRKHDNGISVSHTGYSKVYSMIHLYQNFNEFTNKKFEALLHKAMRSEIQGHLPEFHELRRLRRNKKIRAIYFVKSIAFRIRSILN
jgi:glycosyltransferase involved in cell wall biosynthesis